MKIWKYEFKVDEEDQVIEMQQGSEIVNVGIQDNRPCLWALVHPGWPKTQRMFRVIGTGHEVPTLGGAPYRHVGTFQSPPYVWHLMERPV